MLGSVWFCDEKSNVDIRTECDESKRLNRKHIQSQLILLVNNLSMKYVQWWKMPIIILLNVQVTSFVRLKPSGEQFNDMQRKTKKWKVLNFFLNPHQALGAASSPRGGKVSAICVVDYKIKPAQMWRFGAFIYYFYYYINFFCMKIWNCIM